MWADVSTFVLWLVVATTAVAWWSLVIKTGRSRWWWVAGAAPVATILVTYVVAALQHTPSLFGVSTGFHSPVQVTQFALTDVFAFVMSGHFAVQIYGSLNFAVALDVLAFAVAWVSFVVVALSPWKFTATSGEPAREDVARTVSPPAARATPMSAAPAPRGVAATTSPPAPTRGGVDTRRRLYCPWCGEHIPGNRALGHDCGPKDRPETICRFCGQAFPAGTTTCPTCDAL